MGSSVLLVTMDMGKIAQMSCNPAMGGIAKGQIVREIDALGGYSGIVTDASALQFRMLNRSKGPAMWSPRAQCDRTLFSLTWRNLLENTPNVYFWQDSVNALLIENKKVIGVSTVLGAIFKAKAVIMTNGTFLNGIIHVGKTQIAGGRMGDNASYGLSEQLKSLGFEVGRMKTGTPARIDGRTINFSKLIRQDGDDPPGHFSYLNDANTADLDCFGADDAPRNDGEAIPTPQLRLLRFARNDEGAMLSLMSLPGGQRPTKQSQLPCYIAHTSKNVHDILREGFADSPLFSGTIKGIGPRYCPSIEDKLRTFADKDSHQLFLEPEGWDANEYYIQGFSSSLPMDIQFRAIREVEGLEKAEFLRPGYAIEYDYCPPVQLRHSLETKLIENLYFAGQINGTTGYEEAGAQGLMAGINAHLKLNAQPEFILRRDQAYIGVLIDDLVTKGVDEPYRMFTSRAEYRILLRQDNADMRLTELSYNLGLATKERYDLLLEKKERIAVLLKYIQETSVRPEEINPYLETLRSAPIPHSKKMAEILSRPEVTLVGLVATLQFLENVPRGTSRHWDCFVGLWPPRNDAAGRRSNPVIARLAKQVEAIPAPCLRLLRFARNDASALTMTATTAPSLRDSQSESKQSQPHSTDCFGIDTPRNDDGKVGPFHPSIMEAVEITIKYKGYIEREHALADKMIRLENVRIPRGFDFDKLKSVSIEGRQKLKRYQPETIGQATRITGISPSDISVMLVYFGR